MPYHGHMALDDTPMLIGASDLCRNYAITTQQLDERIATEGFPAPFATYAGMRHWLRDDVADWECRQARPSVGDAA